MRRAVQILVLGMLLSACGSTSRMATSAAPDHLQLLESDCFTVFYDHRCKQARWVSYTLTNQHLEGTGNRKDNFKPDPRLAGSASAHHHDYSRSGYDRGHLAPAADMARSQKCMDESFYYSNISPQLPGCNRGVWKRLEGEVRNWTARWDSLTVYTGPVLEETKNYPALGTSNLCIPEMYYKAILAHRKASVESIAFIVPNLTSKEDLSTFVSTVDSLEVLTGIDFFSHLPDSTQQRIESMAEFSRF